MKKSNKDIVDILTNIARGNTSVKKTDVAVSKIEAKTDVYCMSVPGKAFITRNGDKVSVTGNCHTEGMTYLFREFIKENKEIWTDELKSELYKIAEKMVQLEDAFINLAYSQMDGSEFKQPLMKEDMHAYIRYIADRRLIGLGLKGIFKHKKNPLPWVDEMLALPSHTNFFEQTESSYSKGALTGSWDDVWGSLKVNA